MCVRERERGAVEGGRHAREDAAKLGLVVRGVLREQKRRYRVVRLPRCRASVAWAPFAFRCMDSYAIRCKDFSACRCRDPSSFRCRVSFAFRCMDSSLFRFRPLEGGHAVVSGECRGS